MSESQLRKSIFELLSELSGQLNILAIPRLFIDFIGDVEGALLFSQLLYWTGKGNNPEGWVYKTFEDWEKEISLNKYKVNKARGKMESMGILETKVKKANGNPTVHYRLLESVLTSAFVQFLNFRKLNPLTKESIKLLQTLTETTTETTNRDVDLQSRKSKDFRNTPPLYKEKP